MVEARFFERQWTDALHVAKTQGKELDLAYIEKWARELGVDDLWMRIRDAVFPGREEETKGDVC